MSRPTLSDQEVERQVRQLARQGRNRWTTHAEEKMAQRGISKDQVKQCLTAGYFEERPTISNRPGDIEYKFRMAAIVDGEPIRVVASLNPSSAVVVITLFEASS